MLRQLDSLRFRQLDSLLNPISADAPCGEDLEDTQLLAAFDAFRLFGNDTPLAADTPWSEIRDKSAEALEKSRDLRLLAHLAAALVRTDGLAAFCAVFTVTDRWLTQWWDVVFPRVAEDAVLRKNALNSFADRMAVVDGLRRVPIVSIGKHDSYSLRDLEIASGHLKPTEADANPPNTAQLDAALSATSVDELSALAAAVGAASTALKNIAATMESRSGLESAPHFDPLVKPLSRIETLLGEHLASRGVAGVAGEMGGVASERAERAGGTERAAGAAGEATPSGAIKSRQDAVRAIDAAAAFFRSNEPSSPVPLLLDRAKRLVSRSFLEVLEDIAPQVLPEVKKFSGVKND